MSTHTPSTHSEAPVALPIIRIPDQSKLPEQISPDLRERALQYLSQRFELTETEIQHDRRLCALLGTMEFFHEAHKLITENRALLQKGVLNASSSLGLSTDEPDIIDATEVILENMADPSFTGVRPFLEGLSALESPPEKHAEAIPRNRAMALEDMEDRFGTVSANWTESEHALTDEQMGSRFINPSSDNRRYLSTYFDSAYAGLVDEKLQKSIDASNQGKSRQNWKKFMESMTLRIINSLEQVQPGAERRFLPENCFFRSDGTAAFDAFRAACIKSGQRVLVTCEEYYKIIQNMEGNGITVVPFSDLSELVDLLDSSPHFDFILASEVSRHGTVYPLPSFHEVRRIFSPSTRLIVDSCQSAGRWKHDLGSCQADAVILSTEKGSDLGRGIGALALACDFEYQGLSNKHVKVPPVDVGRTAFSLDTSGLPTLRPDQRIAAISANARKFRELLSAINAKVGNRIKILSPTSNPEGLLGHAMELSIEGFSHEKIAALAQTCGVYLGIHPYSKSKESFRIAFHPYMNNDALKIMAYVLLKACEPDLNE